MHTSQRLWLLDRRQWTGCHRYDIIRVSPRYPGRAPCVTFSSCSYMWYMFTFLFNQFYFVQLFNIFRHCTIPQRPASFPRIDLRTGTAVCGPRRRLSKRHSDAVQRNHELRQLFWRGVRKLHSLRLQCKYVYLYTFLCYLFPDKCVFIDYTRCGNESAQCIKVVSRCDGIQDCVNGWDEEEEQCTVAMERDRFVESGKDGIPHDLMQWVIINHCS